MELSDAAGVGFPTDCTELLHAMYQRGMTDMDINCGSIIDGDVDAASLGQQIFERILAVASGERTQSEKLGLGDIEFVPWQIGAQM